MPLVISEAAHQPIHEGIGRLEAKNEELLLGRSECLVQEVMEARLRLP